MSRARLESAKLNPRSMLVIYRDRTGRPLERRLSARGLASILEAALALRVPPQRLYRMLDRGELATVRRNGSRLVRVLELVRVKKAMRR